MNKNRVLYIHIGMHKTGSSSIQISLKKNNQNLLAKDWEFLYCTKNGNGSDLIDFKDSSGNLDVNITDKFFDLISNSNKQSCIISAEHLFLITDDSIVNELRKVAYNSFEKVYIVVYLRRQDKIALSFKNQAARVQTANQLPSSIIMGHEASPLPILNKDVLDYLSYYSKMELWSRVFGQDNLIIKEYERNELENHDICCDFYKTLNIPVDPIKVNTNSSVSRNKAVATHFLIRNNFTSSVVKFVKDHINDDGVKVKSSTLESLGFYNNFRESNTALNKKYNLNLFSNELDLNDIDRLGNHELTEKDYTNIINLAINYRDHMNDNKKNKSDKKNVLVLGDSHARIFNSKFIKNRTRKINWNVCSVSGATLSGLNNPNSVTKALDKFKNTIARNLHSDALVFLLGEVDVGFVIWYRAQYNNINIQDALKKAVSNYKALLLSSIETAPVFVISTPLPTIFDYEIASDVAKERSKVTSSYNDRINLTLKFNKIIKGFCAEHGICYIDLDRCSLGDNNQIKASLLNPNKLDHHYNEEAYSSLILEYCLPPIRKQIFEV
ncbi:hypothetical protein [Cobetia amphilecti]|uniref:hypothetical protein n=1 Tax=Cobetia amphilecti TaxID=1055104 RepID=UPI0026E184BD|nr:hypothetical protein [Cobetia amphilecti]MDO6815020.1 hypothetical protein [Cobetia amphilecti]